MDRGRRQLEDRNWPWRGRAFATLYSECAELFDFDGPAGQAYGLEVLAHLGRGDATAQLRDVFRYVDGALEVEQNWRGRLQRDGSGRAPTAGSRGGNGCCDTAQNRGAAARAVGGHQKVRRDVDSICLGGGLFYNTYFNSLVSTSGIFKQVFVPINPGNAGLAVGGALMVGRQASRRASQPRSLPVSRDRNTTRKPSKRHSMAANFRTSTLRRPKRSTLRWPHSARVNSSPGFRAGWNGATAHSGTGAFLRIHVLRTCSTISIFFSGKRERSRPFGVAVCEEAVPSLFCGPAASPFMEFQYRVRDDQFRHVMPAGATAIRVQTVAPDMGLFWSLLKRMEQATGSSALVNTSFNAFHEPIVCNPRDAVRVFFGTGLDMLVIGRFILRK